MARKAAALVVWLLVLGARASGQTFGPVPQGQLSGRVLRDPEANFVAEAPDDGWAWSVAAVPNGHVYAARRTADDVSFMVLHQKDGRRRMTEPSLQRFIEGVVASLERQGFAVSGLTHAESDQLFPGSYGFRASLTSPNGKADRIVGFVGARGALYSVSATLGNDADERLFTRFAASFRLLRHVPTFPPVTMGFMVADAVLLALAWRSALGLGRRSQKLKSLGLLVALLGALFTLLACAVARGVVMGTTTPDDLDRRFGQIAGGCLVLIVAARLTPRRVGP